MGAETTNINALGMAAISIMSFLILTLPRRYAALPILIGISYVTLGQVVNVQGLNFTVMRILILAGWVRILFRRELFEIRLNAIDKTIIAFVITSIIAYILLWKTKDAVVNRLGFAYNVIGLYFLFRFVIRSNDEVLGVVRALAVALLPLAALMLIEKTTGRNVLSVFGGVPEITIIRGGHLRCQGPFAHPIIAGTLGATLLPLFLSLWFQGRGKLLAFLGFVCSTVLTITSASSGPAMAYLFAVLGMSSWKFRKNMRAVRWGIILSIFLLNIVMKAPVWFVIARLSSLIGGTGDHRSMLIDQAIRHFDEWWLIGTTRTAHWMPYVLPIEPNMVDITNQFLFVGINGGIIPLVLFVVVIFKCFQAVGQAVRDTEKVSGEMSRFLWCLGVSLFVHVMSFISVSYFDQMIVYWYLLLAIIATTCAVAPDKVTRQQQECEQRDMIYKNTLCERNS